jgi:tyrosyl-tRNA synthetase
MKEGDGMSFAEFNYPLLQAWDWWYMYDTKGIQLQIGGADQYGNIVAGLDFVKYAAKHHPDPAARGGKDDPNLAPFGITVPLLTTAAGEKFGKSAQNAIWLNSEMTSTFDLYQVRGSCLS